MSLFTNEGKIRTFEIDIDHGEIIGDRYLLERVEIEHETASGIALPGQTPETTGWQAGIILLVGNGHRLESNESVPMFFQKGDLVLCERFSGREQRIRGKTYVLMNQTQIYEKIPQRSIKERNESGELAAV